MKKILFALGLLLVGLVLMTRLYFSSLQKHTQAHSLALGVASAEAGLVLSFDHDKGFYEIMQGQDLLQQIMGKSKSHQLHNLWSYIQAHADVNDALHDQKMYLAFLAGEKNTIDFLLSTQFKQQPDPNIFGREKPIAMAAPLNDVFTLKTTDSTELYLGIKGLLAVISNNPQRIHQALQGLKEPQPFARYIQENSNLTKNTLSNAFINFEALPKLWKAVLNTPLNGELEVFNQKETYATLQYNFSAAKVLWTGQLTIDDKNSYYRLFADIPGQVMSIPNFLPQNTANYTAFAINDYANWKKKLDEWLNQRKELEKLQSKKAIINEKYGLDLEKIFPMYFKNQLITFQLTSGEKFGGIALSNGEKVNQLLLDLSESYAPDIKIFREAGLPYAYFGEVFKKFDKPYYAIIDNFMVISNYPSSIQVFLNQYRNNQLLINTKSYQHFKSELSEATLSFYIDQKNSAGIFSRNLKMPYYRQYRSDEGFGQFDGLSVQLSGDKGKFISNLLLLKEAETPVNDTTAHF